MTERPKISVHEHQRRSLQRAMSISAFCQIFNIGRTSTYAQIRAGRLKVRKVGRRTLIGDDDAEEWWRSLPEHHRGQDEAAS
jgi:excisionase family DNA binding protein